LHRAWAQIQDGNARTTPGIAVGFRFIPFYSWYWEFVAVKGLALDINEYMRQRGIAARPVSVRLSWWCCVVRILGWTVGLIPGVGSLLCISDTVLMLVQMSQLKDASMAIATYKLAAAGANQSQGRQDGSHRGVDAVDVVLGDSRSRES